ncbi:PREDICTED: brain protein I3 [Colobus angolensis palliatus]|nr:PREDICTED: brain protein I3 [Colobus angolensis palliatus]
MQGGKQNTWQGCLKIRETEETRQANGGNAPQLSTAQAAAGVHARVYPLHCWERWRSRGQRAGVGAAWDPPGPAPSQAPPSPSSTGIPTHHPRVYNIHSRTVTRYPANSIVVVGGCPVCRVGVLEDCFTFLGIFLAIILFPFGFICCFALRKRRCPNCGATFA